MANIGKMIIDDESPDAIRDAIMASLYSKAAERVEAVKPYVASSIFEEDPEDEDDDYDDSEDDGYEDEE
jgi:hypothetical protein